MIINISNDSVYIDGVQYHRASEHTIEIDQMLAKIATLRFHIDDMIRYGEELYAGCDLDKLQISMVDAEGYIRATKEIHNKFEEVMKDVDYN